MTRPQLVKLVSVLFIAVIIIGSTVFAIVSGNDGAESNNTNVISDNDSNSTSLSVDERAQVAESLSVVTNSGAGFESLFFANGESYNSTVETKGITSNISITTGKDDQSSGWFIVTDIDQPERFVDGSLEVLLTERFFDIVELESADARGSVKRYEITGINELVEAYEIDARQKAEGPDGKTARVKVSTIQINENTFLSWVINSTDMTVWDVIIDSVEVSS